jgi:hypothetical protein
VPGSTAYILWHELHTTLIQCKSMSKMADSVVMLASSRKALFADYTDGGNGVPVGENQTNMNNLKTSDTYQAPRKWTLTPSRAKVFLKRSAMLNESSTSFLRSAYNSKALKEPTFCQYEPAPL